MNFGDKESYLPIQKPTRFIKRRPIFALCCHLGGGVVSSDGENLGLFWHSPQIFGYQNISLYSLKIGYCPQKPNAFFESMLLFCGNPETVGWHGLGFRSKVRTRTPQQKSQINDCMVYFLRGNRSQKNLKVWETPYISGHIAMIHIKYPIGFPLG